MLSDGWELIADPFYDRGGLDKGLFWHPRRQSAARGARLQLAAVAGVALGVLIGQSQNLPARPRPDLSGVAHGAAARLAAAGARRFPRRPAVGDLRHLHHLDLADPDQHVGRRTQYSQDYRNIARIIRLSPLEYFYKIMLPATVPHMFTGLRIGIGLSWLAIIAAEMLTGGVGIGFFIWDAWNSSLISDIIVALFYVGIVGFLLDRLVALIGYFVARGASRGGRRHASLPLDRKAGCHLLPRGDPQRGSARHQSERGQGEFIAIIGHSGCGKSTLLNVVAGLVKATTAGSSSKTRGRRAGTGPGRRLQHHSLLPWLTVYENVRLAVDKVFRGKSRSERHDWVMHNLALVHIEHAKDKRPRRSPAA